MLNLWQSFSETLGAKFLNQFGQVGGPAFETWCLIVSDLSADQIKAGFENFMKSDDEFIDAKKFRKLCIAKPATAHDTNWQAYKLAPRSKRIENLTQDEREQKAKEFWIDKLKAGFTNEDILADETVCEFDNASPSIHVINMPISDLRDIELELRQDVQFLSSRKDPILESQLERKQKTLEIVRSELKARGAPEDERYA